MPYMLAGGVEKMNYLHYFEQKRIEEAKAEWRTIITRRLIAIEEELKELKK